MCLESSIKKRERQTERKKELEGVRSSDREREIEKGLKRERVSKVREKRGERGEKDRQKIRMTQWDIEVKLNTI